jgi:MSHA biogenesis protein MshK
VSRRVHIHRQIAIGAAVFLAVATARATEPLADPTQPPAAALLAAEPPAKNEDGGLDLRAIFHAGDRRIAVINGRRVRENDRIGGARVLAIEVDRVRIQRGDEIVEIGLVSRAFKDARRANETKQGAPR